MCGEITHCCENGADAIYYFVYEFIITRALVYVGLFIVFVQCACLTKMTKVQFFTSDNRQTKNCSYNIVYKSITVKATLRRLFTMLSFHCRFCSQQQNPQSNRKRRTEEENKKN